ncbi:SDR family oxidoreductase [Nocardiopsis sp. MG754419]|uniref:SDR family oxidoreductase n=1 Tax=Nocardiopsis sp. MG754419 TaxID=2259865 RepID=UPI001BA609BF|nr:SDR family oxidoreductase [Nocardiopsis sp. MG754419]MBR8742280.1 NAD(P)-dependent oxidoreductase [Nocardiopsis sp. MG754419]
MSVVVTGATGHLGRLVVSSLLARGLPAHSITATGRDTAKATDLVERGVTVTPADFDDPAALRAAFAGADTVLLVSGNEVGGRVAQHRNAVEAAKEVGVGHLVYTSLLRADVSTLPLAPEHKATEEIITASGLPHTLLRNGFYNEVYLDRIDHAREHGAVVGSAGEGRVAGAARADLAEAAAVVLLDPSAHVGAVYELVGDRSWTYADLAAAIGEVLGRTVPYQDLGPREHREVLLRAGLDEGTADFLVGLDAGIREGELHGEPGILSGLIGRPTTPLATTLRSRA